MLGPAIVPFIIINTTQPKMALISSHSESITTKLCFICWQNPVRLAQALTACWRSFIWQCRASVSDWRQQYLKLAAANKLNLFPHVPTPMVQCGMAAIQLRNQRDLFFLSFQLFMLNSISLTTVSSYYCMYFIVVYYLYIKIANQPSS